MSDARPVKLPDNVFEGPWTRNPKIVDLNDLDEEDAWRLGRLTVRSHVSPIAKTVPESELDLLEIP